MKHRTLSLSQEPAKALAELYEASKSAPVLVFKKSPRCEISLSVEEEFRDWLAGRTVGDLVVAEIDVIAQRELARGLTAELGIQHESPQALLFRRGKLLWHGSHGDLNAKAFESQTSEAI